MGRDGLAPVSAQRATPPQVHLAESRLELFRHGVYPDLLLPPIAVKKHTLNQARVVQAADTHAHQPHR